VNLATSFDAHSLRANLMARDPMQRFQALHALELEVGHEAQGPRARFANQVASFAARGVPYYAPNDPHYTDWVARAVGYWEDLHKQA
jgi:hypothetical protein